MSFVRKFQKGDTVFHRPTGETWFLIEDERDGWVTPGGWPASQGRAEDCKLVQVECPQASGVKCLWPDCRSIGCPVKS